MFVISDGLFLTSIFSDELEPQFIRAKDKNTNIKLLKLFIFKL